ncbi:hypothetical protein MNQ98_14570 [Paenibacillus sp. N3/727]|uniref:hypothetical protein n=1 Tax=Paenibacillus sp. N3/727 TaxID=2925845 RepID=UPI001F52EF82|nr:hypothetical protein [Paenibacillus sp. N3/727]UNK15792.1 hypothetical protein MNQ98_14570 [Paenibacillus sp. N3/727]
MSQITIEKLGLSEDQLISLESQGFGLSKKQRAVMLATYNTPLPNIEEIEELSQNFNIPDDF